MMAWTLAFGCVHTVTGMSTSRTHLTFRTRLPIEGFIEVSNIRGWSIARRDYSTSTLYDAGKIIDHYNMLHKGCCDLGEEKNTEMCNVIRK